MRSIVGLALLMTGLSIGAYAYYPEAIEQHIALANVTRVIAPVTLMSSSDQAAISATESQAQTRRKTRSSSFLDKRSFSPGPRLVTANRFGKKQEPKDNASAANITTASLQRSFENKSSSAHSILSPRAGWTAVVTPAISPRSGSRPMKSSIPADGSARYALVRDIQRELKRVGCYWGKIDGDWGPGSKRAIESFVRTVNAALPTRDPDYILLALLRAQNDHVCGGTHEKTIIAGNPKPDFSLTEKPQLLARPRLAVRTSHPSDHLVKATRTATVQTNAPTRPYSSSASGEPLPGRMTIGGPKPNEWSATQRVPGATSLPSTYKTTSRSKHAVTKARKKSYRKHTRVARAKPKKKKYRRYHRRRNRNPLSNLLRQGVY